MYTAQKKLLLTALLILATILLFAGFILPMMTITKLVFFSDSFSLLLGIYELFENGNYFLFIVIALFSVILPLLKIAILFRVITFKDVESRQLNRLVSLMHEYGRWAMLDVMVVAILIVTVKLGAIASIEVHSGVYIFGLAVLLIMFLTRQAVRMTQMDAA
ncbi:MAG: paraquat-inducible protein A [Thioalkalispiraceae bacterium]|jgi:paraquat-inducible protein A